MKNIKLFCLPYAGGSSMVYREWKKHLNDSIDLQLVELAGRGKRYSESFYNNFDAAIEDIYGIIKSELDEMPYAIWGHSMGSLLAFEVANKLKQMGHKEPTHIFFSGRFPPHISKNEEKALFDLPTNDFKDEILRLGGTPREMFENKELQDIFIPILRADYKILHGYKFHPRTSKFDFDISVLNGKKDEEVTAADISQWGMYTSKECKVYMFDGGHFFINENVEEITKIINQTL